MYKLYLFLLVLIFTGTVFAQTPAKKLTKQEKLILTINYAVESDTVIEVLRKMDSDMRKSFKDKKPLSSLQYAAFSNSINLWIEYRWFIADTGLRIKWLKDIHELLSYMHKIQSYIESAKFSGHTQTAKYQQAVKYFDTAYSRFAELIRKPVKVSGKVQRQAKQQKILWQKSMREKHNIRQQ